MNKKREGKGFQRERGWDSPSWRKRRAIQGFVTAFGECRSRLALLRYLLPLFYFHEFCNGLLLSHEAMRKKREQKRKKKKLYFTLWWKREWEVRTVLTYNNVSPYPSFFLIIVIVCCDIYVCDGEEDREKDRRLLLLIL